MNGIRKISKTTHGIALSALILASGCGSDSFNVSWGFYQLAAAPGWNPDGAGTGVTSTQYSCTDEGVSTVQLTVRSDRGQSTVFTFPCSDMSDPAGGLSPGTYTQECVALDASGSILFTADLSVFSEYELNTLGGPPSSSSQPLWCDFIVDN